MNYIDVQMLRKGWQKHMSNEVQLEDECEGCPYFDDDLPDDRYCTAGLFNDTLYYFTIPEE